MHPVCEDDLASWAVSWAVPEHSRTKVDAAARTLVSPESTTEERLAALVLVNNWRDSHNYPLNTFQMTLRTRARHLEPSADVVQRKKRLTSIEGKIRTGGFRLTQIQDIGGCRAVMPGVADVDALATSYKDSGWLHELADENDYLRDPPASGYRSRHLVFRHFSKAKDKKPFDGLKIEIQIRTRAQHAWATAVETVDTFTGQRLKASDGDPRWLNFFALMGSAIARREGLPLVPGTPTTRAALQDELIDLEWQLDAIGRLRGFGHAMSLLDKTLMNRVAQFFILDLNVATSTLTLHSYRKSQLEVASRRYEELETEALDDLDRDVVLVSASSLAGLKRGYPNYFADTTAFVDLVQAAMNDD